MKNKSWAALLLRASRRRRRGMDAIKPLLPRGFFAPGRALSAGAGFAFGLVCECDYAIFADEYAWREGEVWLMGSVARC